MLLLLKFAHGAPRLCFTRGPEDEKQLVFNEMFRLLKSGGRVAVSDILAKGEMPERIRGDMSLYVGCIAGASRVDAYEKYLKAAGFNGE